MAFFSGPSREDGTVGEARFEVTRPLEGPPSSSPDPSEPAAPPGSARPPRLERTTLEATGRGEGTGRSGREASGAGGGGRSHQPGPRGRDSFSVTGLHGGDRCSLYTHALAHKALFGFLSPTLSKHVKPPYPLSPRVVSFSGSLTPKSNAKYRFSN